MIGSWGHEVSQPMRFSWGNVHTHSSPSVSGIVPSLFFSLSLPPFFHLRALSWGYCQLHNPSYTCACTMNSSTAALCMLCVVRAVVMVTINISGWQCFATVSSVRAKVGVQERQDFILCDCRLSSSFSLACTCAHRFMIKQG